MACSYLSNSRATLRKARFTHLLMTGVLGISLAACGGGEGDTGASENDEMKAAGAIEAEASDNDRSQTAESGRVRFDEALEDKTCAVVTPELVAGVFDVPAGELEQSEYAGCKYEWESADVSLNASIAFRVSQTADMAQENFDQITQSMSQQDVSEAMSDINDEAGRNGNLTGETEKQAADDVSGALSGSIQFESVEGPGQKARFENNDGTLYVLQDNLHFRLTAYKGPDMRQPNKITSESMTRAAKQWHQDTMPERKAQAVKLAKAIVAAL